MRAPPLATSALVTFITLVIWALAETQTLLTERVTAVVAFSADAPDLLVRVPPEETWGGAVQVELSGPAATINRVRETLAQGVSLRVNRELEFVEGRQSADLSSALARHEAIAGSGVTISRVIPDRVPLEMDRAVTVTRPVVFAGSGTQLRETPEIVPDEVRVRVAQQELETLPEIVTAAPAPRRIERLTPGVRETLSDVPLTLGGGLRLWGLRIDPPRVSVTLELRSATDSIVFPAIPVRTLMPTDLVGAWEVTLAEGDRFLRDVRVSGPAATINQWRQRGFEPVAFIRLRSSDIEAGEGTAKAELIDLPASFTADIDDDTIAFTVRRRAAEVPSQRPTPPDGSDRRAEPGAATPAQSTDGPADESGGEPGGRRDDEIGGPGESAAPPATPPAAEDSERDDVDPDGTLDKPADPAEGEDTPGRAG